MILKANLRSRPSVELEIGRQGSKDVKVLKAGGDMPPYQQAGTAAGFDILSRGKANETQLARLQSFIEKYNTSIKRISLQRQMPHLILRTDLPPLREKEAEAFFRDLNEWLMI
jgi:hypothetical protein